MMRVVRFCWLVLLAMPVAQSWADAVLIVGQEAPQAETNDSKEFVGEAAGSSGLEGQWELINQLDLLQQEVQMLRGLVEEQAYQLNRMQKTERDRYLDLDRRISGLGDEFSKLKTTLSSSSRSAPVTPVVAPESVATPEAVTFAPERQLYDRAQGYVQSRKFDLAIVSFEDMLEKYPGGDYVPYGHYWLGEVYMALDTPLMDEAKKHFLVVLSEHPKHPKVPASLFKLGKLFDVTGERDKARKYLDKVIAEHSGSSSAGLADRYKRKWQSPR